MVSLIDMNKFMEEALREAQKAYELDEVPVGAVIVKDGNIIARGHNLTETTKDPTAHAEMIAIKNAVEVIQGFRLTDCDMYVTLEPCAMCAGAIVWSRIKNLYIGTEDPKSGACASVFNVVQEPKLNHWVNVSFGLEKEACSSLLKEFFRQLRKK